MTELDEVAEAIYEKHMWMYPVTPDIALSLASSQMDGQGHTIIHTVADKLFAMNSLDRTPKPLNWNAAQSPNAEVLEVIKNNCEPIPAKTRGPSFWPMSVVDTTGRKYYIDQKRFYSRAWLPGMLPVPSDGKWAEVESAVYDDFQRMVKNMSAAQLNKARK